MRKLFFLLILTILTACASGPYPVSSPYYWIPAGSRLVLKQPLTIPANEAQVFIQYGKVVTSQEKDIYYPHCWFLSWQVLETPQHIKPDTFIVTRTHKYDQPVQAIVPQRVASVGIFGLFHIGDGQHAYDYITELSIHTDSQPDIYQFACNHWEDPTNARHLTVEQIQKTLGDIAELLLKEPN